MNRKVTKFMPDVMDKVIRLAELGMPSMEIGEMVGLDRTGVNRIRSAYAAAKDGDVAKLKSLTYQSNVIQWAAAKFGLSLDEPKPEPVIVPAVQPGTLPETPVPDNTATVLVRILEALETLTGEIRATRDAVEACASAGGRTNGMLTNLENTLKAEGSEVRKIINANGDMIFGPVMDLANTCKDIRRQGKK